MGSSPSHSFGVDPVEVTVTTGDIKRGAGTDNDVYVRFTDCHGLRSIDFKLNNVLKNDFKPGSEDKFHIPNVSCDLYSRSLGEIKTMEIWRAKTIFSDKLFVRLIVVHRLRENTKHVFPVVRWIPMKKPLCLSIYDSWLPQDDPFPEQRENELAVKKEIYQIREKTEGLPVQVSEVPEDERFSSDYQKTFGLTGIEGIARSTFKKWTNCNPKLLDDFKNYYDDKFFKIPDAYANDWYKRDDFFGYQRVAGCNPLMLELCTSIPENFGVTAAMVEPFLENESLADSLTNKRLFLVNYEILFNIITTYPESELPAPLVLLYRNKSNKLVPIAIQLQQYVADNNPVFLPSDDSNTWLLVKMWCNLADSSVHQAKAHLGFTHLMAESIVVVSHRELSPSHPVFKLLAPHFLYIAQINSMALTGLLAEGGFIDLFMSMGRKGTYDILRKAKKNWRMDIDGNPRKDVERRGVGAEVLPRYPYRDYSIELWDQIQVYVTEVVVAAYSAKGSIQRDHEIQAWCKELAAAVDVGGAGIQGIPGDGKEATVKDVIEIVTSTIFMCSVQHAAVNFTQYTEYGFPGTYPAMMRGKPPTSKVAVSERDIVDAMPHGSDVTGMMMLATLLSMRDTQSLGNFEIKYAYDPTSEDALKRFRDHLDELSREQHRREVKSEYPYLILDPRDIPNAISI